MSRLSNHKRNSKNSIRGKNLIKPKNNYFKGSENLGPDNKTNLVAPRNYLIAPQVDFEIIKPDCAVKIQTCKINNSFCNYEQRLIKEHLLSKNRTKNQSDRGHNYFSDCKNIFFNTSIYGLI